jgi:hypothetical protein
MRRMQSRAMLSPDHFLYRTFSLMTPLEKGLEDHRFFVIGIGVPVLATSINTREPLV